MAGTAIVEIYIVAANRGKMTIHWAVATRREEAVAIVQHLLPPDWTASLTDRQITPDQVAALKLAPGGARVLKPVLQRKPTPRTEVLDADALGRNGGKTDARVYSSELTKKLRRLFSNV